MQAEDDRMQRLGESGENPSSLDGRAGAFLWQARPMVGLTDGEIGAIERRLLHRGGVRRGVGRFPALAMVVALGLLVASGSVMALVGGWCPPLPFLGRSPTAAPPRLRPAKARATVRGIERANLAPTAERVSQPSPLPEGEGESAARPSGVHGLAPVDQASSPLQSPSKPFPNVAPAPETRPPGALRPPPRQEALLLPPPRQEALVQPPPRREAWVQPPPHQEALEMPPPSIPSAPASGNEGALSAEARFLSDALARWRRDGNAEAALALLRAHESRFPHGALLVESKVARAEILLTLGRRDQALSVLDSLSLASLPRARELQTLRGELRARVGRCREARLDLSPVLLDLADDLGKRASLALANHCPARAAAVSVSPSAQGLAALCTSTGGHVATAMCCNSAPDFPDSCLTGACGCSPSNSHSVATCVCPNRGCFSTKTGCGARGRSSD
jgi:hypothetical protein